MEKLQHLGIRNVERNQIVKRFRRVDFTIKAENLVISLQEENDKQYHGLIFLPPLKQEIGNFTLHKKLCTHPWYDNFDLPNGPQVAWFTIYQDFRKKGAATTIYQTLIKHFGSLYSDFQQTDGGSNVWLKLARENKVDIYQACWEKNLTFSKLEKYKFQSESKAKLDWFDSSQYQKLLLATPKK